MQTRSILRVAVVAVLPLIFAAGCATQQGVTQADLDALRAEIAQLRTEVQTANANSAAAAASADAAAKSAADAAAEARAASEKADRIYKQSLRK